MGVLLETGIGGGSFTMDGMMYQGPSPLFAPIAIIGGVLLLTLVMHLIRGIGRAHGTLAKHLLVARTDVA
jgi:hypothetical protein